MRKLKLDVDQLTVDSFDTKASDGARAGTVQGFAPPTFWESCNGSCDYTCGTCNASCASCVSCYNTCGNTCGPSCYGTCQTCLTNCQQESCVYVCP
ncbi:MAG TPA: hypothetical protein VFT45_11970 [Longimicrobium sp.]|nr:hypothetical protein [Longimicrobium sp.]